MTQTDEEMMKLNMSSLSTEKNNQMEKYFQLEKNIRTIHRMGSDSQVALHMASFCGHSETVQFFLTDSAFTSLATISSQLTLFDQSKRAEIRALLVKASSLHDFREEIPDNNYIVWSMDGDNLMRKGREFREQIDLYKTYDNQHHLITKLLIEIVEYYLNQYLIEQERFSSTKIDEVRTCFRDAIDEQNYLKYFIKAYTLTNSFHHALNKHLALYILHYFDARSYSSTPAEYRLINCLVHIVTLLINHPDVHQHKYTGITYRGMLMSPNDLKPYRIGHYILNKSFVSTSKDRAVAQMYADSGQESVLGAISTQHDPAEVPVIFKFTIKHDNTGLDIEHMSMIEDEKEVLILPFSVFQVKDRVENGSNTDWPGLVEIDLEQCEDQEQVTIEAVQYGLLSTLRRRSKCVWGSTGLCIMFSLIVAIYLIIRIKPNSSPISNSKNNPWIKSNYSHVLTTNSDTFQRPIGSRGIFYFVAIQVTASANGIYTLVADSGIDTYGYLYNVSFSRTKPFSNLIALDDNRGPERNFQLEANLTANQSVILVVTTTIPSQTGPFNVTVDGPAQVTFEKDKSHPWKEHATTVAGGNGEGSQSNQLSYPRGISVDQKKTILIPDSRNHRVVQWKWQATIGTIVAGGNGRGNGMFQLNIPTHVIVDKDSQSIIICDRGNSRVVRWFDQSATKIQILIDNISCSGLAMDKEGFLYVSDQEKGEVRRWKEGERQGTIVAGGNGKGDQLNQLYGPSYLFIDDEQSVFVSDRRNHRVMKWRPYARGGVIVAGGYGEGDGLNQLSYPEGLVIDRWGDIYVVDSWNSRIMRWREKEREGKIVAGENGRGEGSDQLFYPQGLSFDGEGNLYVADSENHRIQKFDLVVE